MFLTSTYLNIYIGYLYVPKIFLYCGYIYANSAIQFLKITQKLTSQIYTKCIGSSHTHISDSLILRENVSDILCLFSKTFWV